MQRQAEDEHWVAQASLSAADLDALRIAADLSDDKCSRITGLDVASLAERNQVLLMESRVPGCTRLHVLERRNTGFNEVWSLIGVPERSWPFAENWITPAQRTCMREATGHVAPDGRIMLEIAVRMDIHETVKPVANYAFVWDGRTYQFEDDKR